MKHILALLFAVALASATSLTGTLNGPDGAGVTGSLYLQLSQEAALSSAGSCGGPIQVVPSQIRITVTGGSLSGSPHVYGNDCLLPAGTYYIATFIDTNGNTLINDWWLISGSSEDLGEMVSVLIVGTNQLLGQAGVVLTQPTATQTITQPSGTVYAIVGDFSATGQILSTRVVGPAIYAPYTYIEGAGVISSDTSGVSIQSAGGAKTVSGYSVGPFGGGLTQVVDASGRTILRSTTGSNISCSSIGTGPIQIRTDPPALEVCIGGSVYYVLLTAM